MSDFEVRMKSNNLFLSEKERSLADYLLKNQNEVKTKSLQNISDETKMSIATVSRFAKKMGYDSFQELRFALGRSASDNNPLFEEINENDDLLEMANKIFGSNIDALKTTCNLLTEDNLNHAVKLMINAKTLGFFGLGASNIVALDGYHKFLRTEKTLSYANDYHMQLMAITRMKPTDTAIIVSHSGTDKSAIALAEAGKNSGVKMIIITSSTNSPLAQYGDVVFQAVAEEMQFRAEALHALIAQLTVMDALFMMTAIKSDDDDAEVLQKIRQTIQKTRN